MKGALQKHRTVSLSTNQVKPVRPLRYKIKKRFYKLSKFKLTFILSDYENQNYEDNTNFSDTSSYRSGINSAFGKDNQRADSLRIIQEKNSGSLFEGTYDEQEAHSSFQQALLEWRNSSKKTENENKKQATILTSRDAFVETDNSDRDKKNGIKELEDHINSNHSLSYAERILLQKYRRNDLGSESQEFKSNSLESNYFLKILKT